MTRSTDVLIIGAGPAGMACAIEAANAGLDVVVLDENPAPGGQIYRSVETAGQRRLSMLGKEYAAGADLVSAFRQSAARYLSGTSVWNIGTDHRVEYSHEGRSSALAAKTIVVATGALERPCPVPGWTLPGVCTAGALQILLKSAGIVQPDAVLVGSGPLLWLLAAQMVATGTPPKALVENLPPGRYKAALVHLPAAMLTPGYLLKGLSMMMTVRKAGVPVYRQASAIRIDGDQVAEAVQFHCRGEPHRIETTTVALHQGVVPNPQVTRLLRCDHAWDSRQQCFTPQVNEYGETSVENLFVAGDGRGIQGARSAELQGRLLAAHVADRLGRSAVSDMAGLRSALQREARVRPFLDVLYAPSPEILAPADATIVCRCEEVTAGAVREAVDTGAPGPNQVKSFLRAGMGPCQGRVCGLAVTTLIAERKGQDPGAVGYYRIRPPLKPLLLSELANLEPDTSDQAVVE